MIRKILIANRGEIALRIIRACREMGISSVAVYSTADMESLHTQLADEAICIGPAALDKSYLDPFALLSAADVSGADAVHPGFGFLSENARFVRMCAKCGKKFIGPSAEAMERMGDKLAARRLMMEAGVPVIPGSEGALESAAHARQVAAEIGYPVMIKASAGGGGRGIRRVAGEAEIEQAFESAAAEAQAAFGDGTLYMEKCIENGRHIEMQVLADEYGNAVYLYERECSLQRRNQKVMEEAPSCLLTSEQRAEMGAAALRAVQASEYSNAGTVEFLVDESGYYFMELNARIQVEHPVTEMITGIDLIKQQILVASGERLALQQADIPLMGHAIECRINAEDTENGFRPSVGHIEALHLPGGPGVRFDTMLYSGYDIPPYYDSMLGKLICHAENRDVALAKMRGALTELVIEGVETNIDFQLDLLTDQDVIEGRLDTGLIARKLGV